MQVVAPNVEGKLQQTCGTSRHSIVERAESMRSTSASHRGIKRQDSKTQSKDDRKTHGPDKRVQPLSLGAGPSFPRKPACQQVFHGKHAHISVRRSRGQAWSR